MKLKATHDPPRVVNGRVVIPLPESVAYFLREAGRDGIAARVAKGQLIVERRRTKRAKRSA